MFVFAQILFLSFLIQRNAASMTFDGDIFTFSEKTHDDFNNPTHGQTAWTTSSPSFACLVRWARREKKWACKARPLFCCIFTALAGRLVHSIWSRALFRLNEVQQFPEKRDPWAWVIWRQKILQLTKSGLNVVNSGEREPSKTSGHFLT